VVGSIYYLSPAAGINVDSCYSIGSISGAGSVGGVVGSTGNFNTGNIQNCYSTGDVTGTTNVGGVVGNRPDSNLTLNCYSTGNITGTGNSVGGVAGSIAGNVESCYSRGAVSGVTNVGGVAGVYSGGAGFTMQKCYASGTIMGNTVVGGLVGSKSSNGIIQNCYASGNVTGLGTAAATDVGGLLGTFASTGVVENCYATGNVTSSGGNVGGLVGNKTGNIALQNCYATGKVNGTTNVGGLLGNWTNGTVTICVALNPDITGTAAASIGRVVGLTNVYANNYARGNMVLSPAPGVPIINDPDDKHGADVSAGVYNVRSFWETTLSWDFISAWDWGSTNLPILRSMPLGTQNPTVQP